MSFLHLHLLRNTSGSSTTHNCISIGMEVAKVKRESHTEIVKSLTSLLLNMHSS